MTSKMTVDDLMKSLNIKPKKEVKPKKPKMTKEEFYEKIPAWIDVPKERWNHVTLVAYFYHKYFQKNKIHFSPVTWNGNPASSKECRDLTKVYDMFKPGNYDQLSEEQKQAARRATYLAVYNYINWMFDYKHRFGNNSVAVTTQYFISPSSLNQFKIMYDKHLKAGKKVADSIDLEKFVKENYPKIYSEHNFDNKNSIKMFIAYVDSEDFDEDSEELKVRKYIIDNKLGI